VKEDLHGEDFEANLMAAPEAKGLPDHLPGEAREVKEVFYFIEEPTS
jgi:hypothetical protein